MGKLRAVTYNRCSTEEESQKDALIQQVKESQDCVKCQGWLLVDRYVEARSGTTAKGRTEYNRLYQDLQTEKFDIIVIKSLDRLMRNTKDWYLFLDCMQKNGKQLYMYLDRKFYTPDDSLIIGIKAILAEEYSRELSKKINNAHQNRQREGRSFIITNSTYGIRKLPDKSIVLDEKEAEMVRLLFQLSADGYGTYLSSQILYERGYRNRKGEKISASVIRKIIRNPLYKGDVVQNREHYDFESKQQIKNPKSEWLIHEKAIPAIVDEKLFEDANYCMDIRKKEELRGGAYRKYSSHGQYDLSGKVICGLCGQPFYRIVRYRTKEKVIEWKCKNYLESGRNEENGCKNIHLNEKKVFTFFNKICRKKDESLQIGREELLKETLSILKKALQEHGAERKKTDLENRRNQILEKKDLLLQKLLDGVLSDGDFKRKNQEFEKQLVEMEKQLKEFEAAMQQNEQLEKRMADIRERLEGGIIEKAQTIDMIEKIQTIEVFPEYLDIFFDSRAISGWEDTKDAKLLSVRKETDQLTVIRIPQEYGTSPQIVIAEEKRHILQYMKEEPQITARAIAERMEVKLSRIHRRIRSLKEEGKIRYSSPNGRGYWIVEAEEGAHS